MADTSQSDISLPSQASQAATGQLGNPAQQDTNKFFNFSEIKTRLVTRIKEFEEEEKETKARRKLRNIDVNIKAMKEAGDLGRNETYIPIRTIETNITREKPPFISYIKQPQRLMIFTPQHEPLDSDCRSLETQFTKGMTYSGWELSHFKVLDGAQAHGWDFVEVVYNKRYPLKTCIEHVGHDNLIFDIKDAINIQFSDFIMRKYSVSIEQLKGWTTDFDFNIKQVNKLVEKQMDKQTINNKTVYKLFFKADGIVQVAWFTDENGVDDWLKKPTPAFVGIKEKNVQQVAIPAKTILGFQVRPEQVINQEVWENTPLTMYPIFPYYYTVTEAPRVVDRKGRVYLDEHKQEAQTAMATSLVNGSMKASKVYASPKNQDDSGNTVKNLELNLTKDAILNKPFDFWSFPAPSAELIRVLQYFDIANQQETGQVAFAVNNRQDSRKTAKEVESSENKEAQLNSVQVILFSIYMREVYNFVWKIVQSQALQYNEKTGEGIKFLQIKQDGLDQIGKPITYYVNDIATISRDYDLRPAGDVDFIQRQFTIANMMADWPVVQMIPGLREVFLSDLMRLKYQDKGDKYADLVMQGSQLANVLMQASSTIEASMTTDEFKQASPETQQSTVQLLQVMKQMAMSNQPDQEQKAEA